MPFCQILLPCFLANFTNQYSGCSISFYLHSLLFLVLNLTFSVHWHARLCPSCLLFHETEKKAYWKINQEPPCFLPDSFHFVKMLMILDALTSATICFRSINIFIISMITVMIHCNLQSLDRLLFSVPNRFGFECNSPCPSCWSEKNLDCQQLYLLNKIKSNRIVCNSNAP